MPPPPPFGAHPDQCGLGLRPAEAAQLVLRNVETALALASLDGTEYMVDGWADPLQPDLAALAVAQHPELAAEGPFDIAVDGELVLAGVATAADPEHDAADDVDVAITKLTPASEWRLVLLADPALPQALLVWRDGTDDDGGDD